MDINKDYYAILGVLPTALDEVIRAAYKALVRLYHPDCFVGSKGEAHQKMCDLNEAYEILSDSEKRKEYDNIRGNETQDAESLFGDKATDAQPEFDPLECDWKLAVDYIKDLKDLEERLSKFSWRLAYSFRANILETKSFNLRRRIASEMENEFLRTYFGSDSSIIEFARRLILAGYRSAAKSLNNAVRVLSDSITPLLFLRKNIDNFPELQSFLDSYDVQPPPRNKVDMLIQEILKRPNNPNMEHSWRLLELCGGKAEWEPTGGGDGAWSILYGGEKLNFNNKDFKEWAIKVLLPDAKQAKRY